MAKLTYTGTDIEVSYDVKRCIHAAECVAGLRSVFDPDRKPWVDPDAASADEIANTIHACPTGALTYRRLDGGAEEVCDDTCGVDGAVDGPLHARGPLRVRVPGEEDIQVESRVSFCRCGQSANKPFCDNAHQDIGFEASGAIDTERAVSAEVAADALAEDGTKVVVTPHENGPFQFEGVVRISNGQGDSVGGEGDPATFLKPWLCRCGGSKNKPFCDGTHKEIGFEAEGF